MLARTIRERSGTALALHRRIDDEHGAVQIRMDREAAPLRDGDVQFVVTLHPNAGARDDLHASAQELSAVGAARTKLRGLSMDRVGGTLDVELSLQLLLTAYGTSIDASIEELVDDLDAVSELGETESLRLQMAMDRLCKMMSTLSNMLKKLSDTQSSIVQNLK